MRATEKYIPIQRLVDRIDYHYASVTESIVKLQRDGSVCPERLQTLADERTKAFVELAQHYLPDLSHQTLANTWQEVRGQIREIFLRKEDRCRTLQFRLTDVESLRTSLEAERQELRAQFEKARRDYCSKNGNVHKVLREDRQVVVCLAEISRIDKQIEVALNQLDIAKSEAEKKLPGYEASKLFQYLQERHFGTPQYRERGIERRWDRWLAKLIDYGKSKKSFDFLNDTPDQLSELIDQKRDHYKSLLGKLEQSRSVALKKFGLSKQKRLHEKLGIQLRQAEEQLDSARQQEHVLGSELCEIESIQGEYYFQAIEIYRKFLQKLDPEILRVYSECTESPIDDQICARARKINLDIDAESNRANDRVLVRDNLKRYKAAIWELGQRLRLHVQSSSIEDGLIEEIPLDTYLGQLRDQSQTLNETWKRIRKSLIYRAVIVADSETEMNPQADLFEATFLAAASESDEPQTTVGFDAVPFDANTILLATETETDPHDNSIDFNGGFRIFAFFESRDEASSLVLFLERHDITCFVHDPERDGPFTLKQHGQIEDVVVMVKDWRFKDAISLIVDLRKNEPLSRTCPKCKATVPTGYRLCWNCLERLEKGRS